MEKVDKVCKDIEDLKIQGARNVAKVVIEALDYAIPISKAKNRDSFLSEFLELSDRFAGLRATEPMLSNLLIYFTKKIEKGKNVEEMKAIWEASVKEFRGKMEDGMAKIVTYGSNLIKNNSTILTHCHSSTVENIILNAAKSKNVKVICTETRPAFQGRITARNLARNGIEVTIVADSAVGFVIRDADLVLVGCDVITVQGQLINKVGTSVIAMLAYENRVPFYSAGELWKFDPATRWGAEREIEMRPLSELISDMNEKELKEFKGVKIINPAFDVTEQKYITSFITEEGIIPPQNIADVASRALGL